MGVVITTLDHLPEFCNTCPCYHIGYCKADKGHRESYGYRPCWCPLREEREQKYGSESYNILAKERL